MSTPDFFRARLDQMIDLKHPLAVLGTWLPWSELEASLAPYFARQQRAGEPCEVEDLFGAHMALAGAGMTSAGRPRLPMRLMLSLLYLKHAFDLSDEAVLCAAGYNIRWLLRATVRLGLKPDFMRLYFLAAIQARVASLRYT